jgi:hypothetical protein
MAQRSFLARKIVFFGIVTLLEWSNKTWSNSLTSLCYQRKFAMDHDDIIQVGKKVLMHTCVPQSGVFNKL